MNPAEVLAENRQRAVSLIARPAEQLVSNLFLNHDSDGLGLGQRRDQLGQHIGGDIVGQIGRYAQGAGIAEG